MQKGKKKKKSHLIVSHSSLPSGSSMLPLSKGSLRLHNDGEFGGTA
jgi:hypothetical protein